MSDIPFDVVQIVGDATPDGIVQFGGEGCQWSDLDAPCTPPQQPGVYALGLTLGVQYERAVSRILYIGSTANLRTRLRAYWKDSSHLAELPLLKHRYPHGLLVSWVALPGLSQQWLRAIEDAALQAALAQFGSYPALNRGRIDSPLAPGCMEMVRVLPCPGLPFPRALRQLGEQVGSKSLGKLADPKPVDYWKDKQRTPSHATVVFTSTPQPELPAAEPPRQEGPEVELLPWVMPEHVAMWNIAKMQAVVAICRSLPERPKRGHTKVRTFIARTRETPRPHTWGEVALIQGRIVADTWLPSDRLWIKIMHEKELLGQAIFDKGLFDGWDKSDLPQTLARPSLSDCESWWKEVETIEGQLPADFAPPPDEIQGVDASTFPEHYRLVAGSHAMDIEWEEFRAIDQDKWRRVREVVCERIESTFRAATQSKADSQ